MGSCNEPHITQSGAQRAAVGCRSAPIGGRQTHPHKGEPEKQDRIYGKDPIFRMEEETYQGGYGIGKPNSHATIGKLHW